MCPESPQPRQPRILIVDNDEHVLQELHQALATRFRGAQVLVASDAREAHAIAATGPLDVILCEYRLAGATNGVKLLDDLSGGHPVAAHLILTSSPDRYLVARSRQDGFSVLVKPVSPRLVLQLVFHHLRARGYDSPWPPRAS